MNSIINTFKKREKYWFDKIVPFLGEETVQILKIGNGFGYMSEMISGIQPLLKILDINIYKETINKDKVQLYDGCNIPFKDNSFNISILNLTLHHIPNNFEYFKEVVRVKKKVAEGELNIFFIIAPPRSNSTLIEYILSLSTDIDVVCHEPFVGARKIDFDPEVGYKNIYDQLGGDHFLNSTSRKTILIKEMSQWLIESHEYKNLLSLTQNKILILIRNPLLTVESRIRRILKSLNLRPGLSLQQYLLDFFSKEDGIINFNEGLKTLNFGSVLQGAICEADKLGLRSDEM